MDNSQRIIPSSVVYPPTPLSDQDGIFPYNINAISSKQTILRIKKISVMGSLVDSMPILQKNSEYYKTFIQKKFKTKILQTNNMKIVR